MSLSSGQKFAEDQKEEIDNALGPECRNCGRKQKETELYQCSFERCELKDPNDPDVDVYCKTCGNMAHIRFKNHTWLKCRKQIKAMCYDLSLVKTGYVKLDLALSNRSFSGVKQIGLQAVSYVSGSAVAAGSAYSALLYGGNAAKVNVQLIDLVVDVTKGVQHGSKALKHALKKATPWAIVAAASFDIVVHSYRFWRGDIEDWKEFGWYCTRSITAASGSGLGGWGGAALGAQIGTAILPGGGTIAGAIIGGVFASILAGTITSKIFDRVWENPNQKKRERLVREAISWFHFRFSDIVNADGTFNETKFNKTLVMKQYRRLAKIYHPDRKDGDVKKWHEIQIHLGLLLALCEKKPTKKNEAVKHLKAIAL